MPFHIKRVSDKAKQRIAAYFETAAAQHQLRRILPDWSEKQVRLSFVHKAYGLALDQLASGCTLTAACPTSTRILVATREQQILAVAELMIGEEPAEVGLATGKSLSVFLEGLERLEKMPVYAQQEKWEMRLLRCAQLEFSAIWLHHSPGEGSDTLMPLGKTLAGCKAGEVYSGNELLKKLKKAALRQLEQTYAAVLRQRIELEQERIGLEQNRLELERERLNAERERMKQEAGKGKLKFSAAAKIRT